MTTFLTRRTRTRRALTLGAAILSTGLLLAGCGSDTSPESDATASATDFPVTIDTQYGQLTVEEQPETIMVLGSALDVDMLDALGAQAEIFGMIGSDEEEALATAPWDEGRYGEYDEGLFDGNGPAAESIAAHNPDLIIYFGAGAPLEQPDYETLSEIAPTYAYARIPAWKDEITALSQLTGTTDRAQEVSDGIGGAFADAREKLPGLDGKSYFQGFAVADGLYSVSGVRQFFSELALEPSEMQATEKPATISLENLDKIDADVFFLGGEGEPRDAVTEDPRFDQLPSVQNGTMVELQPLLENVAFPTQVGPASVPWMLDRLVPLLEESKLNQEG